MNELDRPDDPYRDIRDGVRAVCAQFSPEYFRAHDEARTYPEEFVDALTRAGWLAALIPQEYGGAGLGLAEASVIMEEINRCGGNAMGRCTTWVRWCAMVRRSRNGAIFPRSLPANCACSRWR
jgi:acyl-CoA dehydrogenase